MQCAFNDLPIDDILFHVLKYLDIMDIYSSTLVCYQFNQISKKAVLWNHLLYRDYSREVDGNNIYDIYKTCKRLTTLNTKLKLNKSINELSNLQKLSLHNNQLQSLPSSIGQLSNLRNLYLSGNQLKEQAKQLLPNTTIY